MPTSEEVIFIELFKAVCRKCFGTAPSSPLTEPECRHLSNEIEEHTGLVIGWKSLKNYSLYSFEDHPKIQVNPSVSSLDTLARYLQDAPRTDELKRKQYEQHFPYWFAYRDQQLASNKSLQKKGGSSRYLKPIILLAAVLLLIVVMIATWRKNTVTPGFEDNFDQVSRYPGKNGWMIKDRWDSTWNHRSSRPSHLTLFTISGDNIPDDSLQPPGIRNLLLRELATDCFIAEIHLTDFTPVQNWQQACILLMEDSTYQGRSVRMALVYNDFFGGYKGNAQISMQVLANTPGNSIKPEVVVQIPLFTFDGDTALIKSNLRKSVLRIEKKNDVYRFLFASGSDQIFAFKEIASKTLDIEPRYIALYASSGKSTNTTIIPVWVDKFLVKPACND